MDVIDRLRTLLRPCAWVRDSATALRLIPELAVDLPVPLEMVGADGAGERAIPARCLEALAVPTATIVLQLAEMALDGKPREELHRAGADRILKDPLVPVIAELLAQGAGPGLCAQGMPALGVAWLSSRILTGASAEIRDIPTDLTGRASRVVARINDLPPTRRGAVLSDVTWGLRGRLAAAVSVAQAGGWTVAAGGLYRRVMSDPLVLAYPRGTLDNSLPFGVLSVMLGLPLEESLAGAIEKAAAAVLPALLERRSRGKATPSDDALASGFNADLAASPTPHGVLFDLWSGPLLVAALPDLADVRLLTKAGVSKEVAQALVRRDVVRALAASWRDLVVALLSWDVLSAIVSRLVPIRSNRGRWEAPNLRLQPHARWDLLVPRPVRPAAECFVVAVNLSALRARAAKIAAERGQPLLAGAADGAWSRLILEEPTGVYALQGERGLACFRDPNAALHFARRAARALSGPGNLPVGYLGDPIDMSAQLVTSVGIAHGEIRGGTDGEAVWLDGPAVGEAISLSGNGNPPDIAQDLDPSGVRGAGSAPDGLRSRGVVASSAALRAMVADARDRGMPVHVRGKPGSAAGIGEEFAYYPMMAWWEDEGDVHAALALAEGDTPVELLKLDRKALEGLHQADIDLAQTRRTSRPPGGLGPAPSPFAGFSGASDPFGGGALSQEVAPADPFGGPVQPSFGAEPGWAGPVAASAPPRAAAPAPVPPASPPRPAAPPPRASEVFAPPAAAPTVSAPTVRAAPRATPPAPPIPAGPRQSQDPFAPTLVPTLQPMPAASQADMQPLFPDEFPLAPVPGDADPFADADTWVPPNQTMADPAGFDVGPAQHGSGSWAAPPSPPAAPAPASSPAPAARRSPTPATLDLPDPFAMNGPAPLMDRDPFTDDFAAMLSDTGQQPADHLFGADEGPSVSIEDEDDGWGGDSGLDLASFKTVDRTPQVPPSWDDDRAESVEPGGAPSPRPGTAGMTILDEDLDELSPAEAPIRTENILELEVGSGTLAFGQGGGRGGWSETDIAEQLARDSGGAVLSLDDPDDAAFPPAAQPAPGPITFSDVMAAPAAGDPSPFPEWNTGGFGQSDEDEDSLPGADLGGFALADESNALPDWETGSFEISESDDAAYAAGAAGWSPTPPTPTPEPPPARASVRVPPSPPAPAPAPVPSSGALAVPDFGYLFQGYVLFEDAGEVVFGRPYGKLLVDAHAYKARGDLDAAYRGFLTDKIREGFVPRTDLTRPFAPERGTQKLDPTLLVRAYRAMV